jgi:hypothetical protein
VNHLFAPWLLAVVDPESFLWVGTQHSDPTVLATVLAIVFANHPFAQGDRPLSPLPRKADKVHYEAFQKFV